MFRWYQIWFLNEYAFFVYIVSCWDKDVCIWIRNAVEREICSPVDSPLAFLRFCFLSSSRIFRSAPFKEINTNINDCLGTDTEAVWLGFCQKSPSLVFKLWAYLLSPFRPLRHASLYLSEAWPINQTCGCWRLTWLTIQCTFTEKLAKSIEGLVQPLVSR